MGVQALLEKPACGFLPEIVKGEIDKKEWIRVFSLFLKHLLVRFPCPGNGTDKGLRDRVQSHFPHIPIDSTGETDKNPDGLHRRGHDPLLAVLRLRKRHRPFFQVHLTPSHPCNLRPTHSRFQSELDNTGKDRRFGGGDDPPHFPEKKTRQDSTFVTDSLW